MDSFIDNKLIKISVLGFIATSFPFFYSRYLGQFWIWYALIMVVALYYRVT